MINRLRLQHYKGFRDFTLDVKGTSLLVGPNNAGKTTIIAALRLCIYVIRYASSRKPEVAIRDSRRERDVVGYHLSLPAGEFVQENIRHEFREEESRIELTMKNRSKVYIVWPVDGDPYFYLEHTEGLQPRNLKTVKDYFPSIGVVPTLSPVEYREYILTARHVKENISTRLTSRHFRNQLYVLAAEDPNSYKEATDFLVENTSEVEYLALVDSISEKGDRELDLFYCESSTRTEKELYWSGDGLQIWLQVLFHLWRLRDVQVLVLDEPDVFLHPDLQRRLIRLVEDIPCQVILATHAPEMLAEVSRDSVVLVDRTKKRSKRMSDDQALGSLNDALGSGFNLRLAKALRSRVVLFVEGKDMKILTNLAKTLGASYFSKEVGLTVVPMEGYSNRGMSGSFGWLNSNFLGGAVDVFVVIDRDYRSQDTVSAHVGELESSGVHAHVWARKELESYLLVPDAISRISGLDTYEIKQFLLEVMEELRGKVFSRFLAERDLEKRSGRMHLVSIAEEAIVEFDKNWNDYAWRLGVVPPKEVLSALNARIQEVGGKSVSMRGLSARLRADEISTEMRGIIARVENLLRAESAW